LSSIISSNETVAAWVLSEPAISSCIIAPGKIVSLWVILYNLGIILVYTFSISSPTKEEGNLIISLSPANISPDKIAWVLSVDGPAGSNHYIALGKMVSLL
jgi:hypothetical protein